VPFVTEARKTFQTNKPNFLPPGQAPPPKKVSPKVANARAYAETTTLTKLRTEMETIGDTVGGATPDDWKNADPEKFIGHINKLIEMLNSAKKAIREAEKTIKKTTKEKHQPSLDDRSPARATGKETPDETPAKATTARRKAVS
jgi:hypothetical protein